MFSAQPPCAQENRQMNAPRWNMGSTVYWLTTSSGSLYSIMCSPIRTWARITLKKLRSLSITPSAAGGAGGEHQDHQVIVADAAGHLATGS